MEALVEAQRTHNLAHQTVLVISNKADAYGLGAARMAGAMSRLGVRRFAAYGASEAVEVAESATEGTVLVLQKSRSHHRERTSSTDAQGGSMYTDCSIQP